MMGIEEERTTQEIPPSHSFSLIELFIISISKADVAQTYKHISYGIRLLIWGIQMESHRWKEHNGNDNQFLFEYDDLATSNTLSQNWTLLLESQSSTASRYHTSKE
ncbi:hypothetical protein K1719_001024 [Acacia pycnantha]|nr:hypothetical protein K1719_001024 [Acacia pycnantha]